MPAHGVELHRRPGLEQLDHLRAGVDVGLDQLAARACPRDSDMMYVIACSRLSATPTSGMCGLFGIHTWPPDQAVVPPTRSAFSNTPTVAPDSAATTAAVRPAAPVPMTTTSNSSIDQS